MPDFTIQHVRHDWVRFGEIQDLTYDILYGPFGIDRDSDWYHPEHGSEFIVALDPADRLIGTARLLPYPFETERQVRQVAVIADECGKGVGRALMEAIHGLAVIQGAEEVWLHARASAIGFYEALGYVAEGEEFTSKLTGIPHRTMRRSLRS